MAEAVGLALGVAGLAGIFNACMEACSLFNFSRSHGRDFEIIMIRLDIEKTLLLQWAERVGLVGNWDNRTGYDNRLKDRQTHSVVENALSCVLLLLTDSERLRSEYGLILSSATLDPPQDMVVESSSGMRSSTSSYRRLQTRMGIRQHNAGHRLRTRWAIRDRERFSSLIDELKIFIQSLNELVPASEHHQRLLVEDGIERIAQDLRSLRLVQEASARDHRDWSEAASIRADASEMSMEGSRHIEDWLHGIQELPQEDSHNASRSDNEGSIPTYDPEAFKIAATDSTENLVQLCESGSVSVTATDRNGHSLLRVSCQWGYTLNFQSKQVFSML